MAFKEWQKLQVILPCLINAFKGIILPYYLFLLAQTMTVHMHNCALLQLICATFFGDLKKKIEFKAGYYWSRYSSTVGGIISK